MRVLLPWTSHLLPAVAARLVEVRAAEATASTDLDLGDWLVVVRGRSAGRRLLALLATEAQRIGRALIPPQIVTPGTMEQAMFEEDTHAAGSIAQRLAWTLAVQRASPELLGQIWRMPDGQDRNVSA